MNQFSNLMCVKSIITIAIVIAIIVLSFLYPDEYSETMRNAVTMIVTFYFTHQTNKQQGSDENDRDRRIKTQREN